MASSTINPLRLGVREAAQLLGVPASRIQVDIDAGAPQNPDGTISLIVYAAWLNLQLQSGPDGL